MKDMHQFISICKMFAKKRGYHNDAEDFAQEATIARLRNRKATVGQLFIDYLRKYYASSQTKSYLLEKSAILNYKQLVTKTKDALNKDLKPEDRIEDLLPRKLHKIFSAKEQMILQYYIKGYNQKEISKMLDHTPSRTNQLLKVIINKIKELD